jgi:hypothetical protein
VHRVAAHPRGAWQTYQWIDQIDERRPNPRQFIVVIGDVKGRVLLDRLALPLRERALADALANCNICCSCFLANAANCLIADTNLLRNRSI